MGDLGNKYTDAIGSQIHYTYGVSDIFGFDSSVGYSNHAAGNFSMTTLLAGVRTNLAWYDKVVPYAVFGLGFYRPSYRLVDSAEPNAAPTNKDETAPTLSPILFGVHLGPGVSLELTQSIFFGAALTFHDMFGSTEVTPKGKVMDVGGTFTSFYLNAGVTF